MQKDLISVIIPCYNVEKYLGDCVTSLSNQTYKNFEAIFVDDGSKDGTLSRLNELCSRLPNAKILHKPNGGVSSARNFGLAHADGEYIAFLDPDDMYRPNYLGALLNFLKENNLDAALCGFEKVKENLGAEGLKPVKIKSKPLFCGAEEIVCRSMTNWCLAFAPWNKLVKREVMERTCRFPNLFDETIRYGEDFEFSYRCLSYVERAGVLKDRLYCYRTRKGSLCHSGFNENLLTVFNGTAAVAEDARSRFKEGESYANAYAGVMAMEMLWRMHRADYQNAEKIEEMFAILRANMQHITGCKLHPWWRRRFSPLALKFLKSCHRKRLKKLRKQSGSANEKQ